MGNEHGRGAYIGNLGLWTTLAQELAPAIEAALDRACKERPDITRSEAHTALVHWLRSHTAPYDPDDDDEDEPPPERDINRF